MTKRAVIYCRVSTKEQTQNLSLDTQKKHCIEYCQHNGFVVDEILTEEGESAKTIDRTEFKKLLEHCRKNKGIIKTVVVYSLSRFSRNTNDHTTIRASLASFGINLRSVTERIDETPMGRFLETLMSGHAQLDNDLRGERTLVGMKESTKLGRWNHKAPTGYTNGLDALGKKTILLDKKIAPFIKEGFEIFSNGTRTKKAVLDELTEKGLRDRNGKNIIPQTFDKILRNPIYAGWNVEKKWDIRERGIWEPLISVEVFDKVQAILNGKGFQNKRKKENPDFPLRGLVICGECKNTLTASWSKGKNKNNRYGYYFCQNKQCRKIKAPKEALETSVLDFLQRVRFTEEEIVLFSKKFIAVLNKRRSDRQRDFQMLTEQLKGLRMKKQGYAEARFIEKSLDLKTYKELVGALDQETTRLEIKIGALDLSEIDVEGVLNYLKNCLEHLREFWKNGSMDQKRALVRLLWPDGKIHVSETIDDKANFLEKVQFIQKKLGPEEGSMLRMSSKFYISGSMKGDYQTLETPVIITAIREHSDQKANMVAPRGIEPRLKD